MPRKNDNVAVRLDAQMIERVDRIGSELARRAEGVEISRSATLRAAIVAGVEVLERRLALVPEPKKSRTKS